MGDADLQIVAFALILAATYGLFLYMYSAQPTTDLQTPTGTGTNYSNPSSGDFFSNVDAAVQLNVDNPEIFFVNSILFSTIAFLLVFVGLRWLRGTG